MSSVGTSSTTMPPAVPPVVGEIYSEKGGPGTPPPIVAVGAVPEVKEAVVTQAPEAGRKFPCKNCGARLDFDPSQRALKCPYCGFVEEIAPTTAKVQEHDYAGALKKLSEHAETKDAGTIAGRKEEVRCPGCGAQVLLEDNVQTDKCPFCATHLENAQRTQAQDAICPECLLPFKVSQRDAIGAFNKWISALWFAPGNLKAMANIGQLSGIYLPYWTYDSMSYTHYTGQRGDDYWETETYTETNAQGQSETKTRQVQRTRWTYVSGEVDHFFDDVLVCASKSVPGDYVVKLEPWDLKALEDFKADYLAGFKTERYVVDLAAGFGVAQVIMDKEIRRLCCRDIGGDHQQLNTVNTQHVGVTYKHILLPLWLAVYRYQEKTYRILVNARTGEVTGTRPYSAGKIAAVVAAGLLVIIGIFILISMARH